MRLNSLRLTNFQQHCDTFVTFDTGLTGIIGANGSGKSTLLEAIAWALYGQDAARGKKETLRSLRAGPNARVKVELDFELGTPLSGRARAHHGGAVPGRLRRTDRELAHRGDGPPAPPARHEPRGVLQHLLHGAER